MSGGATMWRQAAAVLAAVAVGLVSASCLEYRFKNPEPYVGFPSAPAATQRLQTAAADADRRGDADGLRPVSAAAGAGHRLGQRGRDDCPGEQPGAGGPETEHAHHAHV